MEITLGQQYNVGEKPTVILYTYINSHIQRIGCQPEKNYFTRWAIPLVVGKKSLAAPPRARARCSFGENKNKKSRSASTCLGATQVGVTQVVSVRLASVQGFLRLYHTSILGMVSLSMFRVQCSSVLFFQHFPLM